MESVQQRLYVFSWKKLLFNLQNRKHCNQIQIAHFRFAQLLSYMHQFMSGHSVETVATDHFVGRCCCLLFAESSSNVSREIQGKYSRSIDVHVTVVASLSGRTGGGGRLSNYRYVYSVKSIVGFLDPLLHYCSTGSLLTIAALAA